MPPFLVAALLLLLVESACSPATQAESTTTALPSGTASGDWPRPAEPGGLAVPECAGDASCAISFALDDGIVYSVSCSAVRESTVADDVIGRGQLQSQEVTVNRIGGVARSVMVAVSLPGGLCAEDDVVRSPWSMAFPEAVDDVAARRASCEVGDLSGDQREANDC